MSESRQSLICTRCHAIVDDALTGTACPACGSTLIPLVGGDLDPAGTPPATVDRRGIVLPRRHAVGGVITPR